MNLQLISEKETAADGRPGFPLTRVCVLFFFSMAILHGILWIITLRGHSPLAAQTTVTISWLLNAGGITNSVVNGNEIMMTNGHWLITAECSAVAVYILYISFVLAYNSSLKAKTLAFGVGIPFICIINLGRLFLLGVITEWFPSYAPMCHDYVWEVLFLILIVLMWLAWIDLVVKREANL